MTDCLSGECISAAVRSCGLSWKLIPLIGRIIARTKTTVWPRENAVWITGPLVEGR
jgi:hypothetical protein